MASIVRYRMPIEPLVMVMAITGFCWTLKRFQYRYRDNTSPLSLNVTSFDRHEFGGVKFSHCLVAWVKEL